jgi:ubiquinone/menaquinone biosynthesis C-methylase UbiE
VSTTAFDNLAAQYDRLWTRTTVGQLQREAVWRRLGPLFAPGQSVLDLGCGTGEDARRLMDAVVRVRAIDSSAEMVRIARDRGVDAEVLAIEECGRLSETFDVVLSNFGALNCVESLDLLSEPLARLVKPGGHLAICVIVRFCIWETGWALLRGQFTKAFRRWRRSAMSSLGFRVFYPSKRRLKAALDPQFKLVDWRGIGLTVPPSYVTSLSAATLNKLDAFDRHAAQRPILRGLADHRLFIFTRDAKCQ